MYVIVGQDVAGGSPVMVVGPFPTWGLAAEFKRHLERTTQGVYVILTLHTPRR